ncbi:hypothetical protein YC2023_093863 [Brassica napus]
MNLKYTLDLDPRNRADLLRFEDEEVEESYQRLRERERSHAYLHNCARAYCSTMDHTYLIPHLRLIMVQWIVQVNIIIMFLYAFGYLFSELEA